MSWRERLLPASFRGVPFGVEGSDDRFGRRGQTHEFPARDVPYHEDLGRAARQSSLTAFLIGDDYLEQRDRLLSAIEEGGPGTLVHPWFGSLQVCIDGSCSVSHRWDEGGYCAISLAFVEAGEQRYPTRGRDTEQALLDQAAALDVSAVDLFAQTYDVLGVPDYVVAGSIAQATAMLDELAGKLAVFDAALLAPLTAIQDQVEGWLGPVRDGAAQFAASVSGLWSKVSDLSQKPLQLQSQIRSLLAFSGLPSLRPFGLWPTQSAATRRGVINRNATAALLRQTAVAQALRLVATLPSVPAPVLVSRPAVDAQVAAVPSLVVGHQDLLELRAELGAVLDQESLRAADDLVFQQIESVRVAAHADLTDRASQAPRLVTLQAADVLPAVVLAALWQDDASRADELVTRNRIRHPGFVPVVPIKLVSQ